MDADFPPQSGDMVDAPAPEQLFADERPALQAFCAAVGAVRPEPEETTSIAPRDWNTFQRRCEASALPSVRVVLEKSGPRGDGFLADLSALAAALVILERVRDAKRDWTENGTLHLPESFFTDAALSPERLGSSSACGQTRAVLDRVLDGADTLLAKVRPLKGNLGVVLCLALRMASRLRREDPLKKSIRLRTGDRLVCAIKGLMP